MSITNAQHLEPSSPGVSYRPLLELGRGGMARVQLAERVGSGLHRLVVLKVLNPELSSDLEMRSAFRREAELCAQLNHPNIVQVFEVLEEGASLMMVMEYVDGVPLTDLIAQTAGHLPLRVHVHIIMQVLAALHYFHELKDSTGTYREPVHRDISPSNVVVMHEGMVKVLDFGIAKVRNSELENVTQSGLMKGKLRYMPAEQVSADASIDRRADIFAAGVMLWEAFAQRRMWQGFDNVRVLKALISGAIPAVRQFCPGISRRWERIVNRAIAANREERYPTARAMHEDMEACLSELGGPVPQHELAAFMRKEFGEWRVARRREVEARLATSTPFDTVSQETFTVRQPSSAPTSQREPSGMAQEPAPRQRPWPVRSTLLAAGILFVASAVVAALLLWSPALEGPRDAATSSSSRPIERRIQITITAKPESAVVLLDRKPLGKNPWFGELVAANRKALVEATAPGYEPFQREVSLAGDVALYIQLAPTAPSAQPLPPAPSVPRQIEPPTRSVNPRPRRNCDIPYVIDADGVKTYKVECLSK